MLLLWREYNLAMVGSDLHHCVSVFIKMLLPLINLSDFVAYQIVNLALNRSIKISDLKSWVGNHNDHVEKQMFSCI